MFFTKKILLRVLTLLICIGGLNQPLKACSHERDAIATLYPTPDQVCVTPSCILLYSKNRDRLLPVKLLTDLNGALCAQLNEEKIEIPNIICRGPCGLHPVWHKECGGCGVLLCPMNCTCFD